MFILQIIGLFILHTCKNFKNVGNFLEIVNFLLWDMMFENVCFRVTTQTFFTEAPKAHLLIRALKWRTSGFFPLNSTEYNTYDITRENETRIISPYYSSFIIFQTLIGGL